MKASRVLSLLVGILAAALVFSLGALISRNSQAQSTAWPLLLRVEYIPDPHDIVTIRYWDPPYVVPDGKILVLRDWSLPAGYYGFTVSVDGVTAWEVYASGYERWSSLGVGVTARAGQTVTVNNAFVSGFLVDE